MTLLTREVQTRSAVQVKDRGVYQMARFQPDGTMQMLGQFTELSAAIEIGVPD